MKKLDAGLRKLKYGRFDFYVREKETVADNGPPKVSFVVKADVDGSLDAILGCLKTYKSEEVDMVFVFILNLKPSCFGFGANVMNCN